MSFNYVPSEAEVQAAERAAEAERRIAIRMQGLEREQQGSIRGEKKKRSKRKAARTARKRNR